MSDSFQRDLLRGSLDLMVLSVLADEPQYGYSIQKQIRDVSQGRVDLKAGDAYGRNSFGQRCLLSRRLVEAGVPFITVYDGGWDHHSDIFGACRKRLPDWDATVATLISDLDERGMLESTLVVALDKFSSRAVTAASRSFCIARASI